MKKGSKKWGKKNAPSRHHLWTRKMRAGRNDRQETKMFPRHLHQKWHSLVEDASPSEALFSIAEFLPEQARTKLRILARELREEAGA